MTISIKSPTSTTGSIQKNGSDVLTFDSSDNVTVVNNLSVSGTVSSTGAITFDGGTISGDVNFDSGTLYVDATNNRVGIGTSSPSYPLDISSSVDPVIKVNCSGTGPNTGLSITKEQGSGDLGHWNAININGNDNISYESRIQWVFDSIADGPIISGKRTGSGETEFYVYTNQSETAYKNLRIDAYGNYDFGHVAEAQIKFNGMTAGAYVDVKHPSSAGSGYGYIRFFHNGSIIGQIAQNGTTAVSYNTSSDHRLKENNVGITDGITRVKQLKPYRFNFIAEPDTTVDGFFAHEAQTVVPESVTGTHNEVEVWKEDDELPEGVSVGDNKTDEDGNTIPVYQGIDQSKLVPLLTAALQEAITKIEDLETRIQALENPNG
jgi:hypothetical protein